MVLIKAVTGDLLPCPGVELALVLKLEAPGGMPGEKPIRTVIRLPLPIDRKT